MLVASLGSGSAGNSYYFESDGTRLLVDAGFGPRETERRLASIGRSIADLNAILITHEHYDHIRGADKIGRKFDVPIYLTRGTLEASAIDREIPLRTVIFPNNSSFRVGEIQVHARRTMHDAADPACYVLEAGDGTRVGIASDLGSVDAPVLQHLQKCDGLFFEANHDLDMLRTGSYPWSLKRRIMSPVGHLSNDDSLTAVRRMIGEDLKALCLIHLSQKNNHESIVRAMAEGVIRTAGADVKLDIARQDRPMPMMSVTRKSRSAVPAAQLTLF